MVVEKERVETQIAWVQAVKKVVEKVLANRLNKDKIILDLCGGTGSWSKPYFEAGYNVINITLPEHDVRDYIPPDNIYGILAAPPCTMFSLARTRANLLRQFFLILVILESDTQKRLICGDILIFLKSIK